MTQYIADLLKKLQVQLTELADTVSKLIAPEDADYVYIDKSRGGLDNHSSEIPPYENNEEGE